MNATKRWWIDPLDRGHYCRRQTKIRQEPNVGKTGKGAITLLWAFGLLLLSNGKVSSEQEHGTRGPKGSLGLSSLRWRAAPEDKNRSRARSEEHTSELQSQFHLVDIHSFPTRRSSDLNENPSGA